MTESGEHDEIRVVDPRSEPENNEATLDAGQISFDAALTSINLLNAGIFEKRPYSYLTRAPRIFVGSLPDGTPQIANFELTSDMYSILDAKESVDHRIRGESERSQKETPFGPQDIDGASFNLEIVKSATSPSQRVGLEWKRDGSFKLYTEVRNESGDPDRTYWDYTVGEGGIVTPVIDPELPSDEAAERQKEAMATFQNIFPEVREALSTVVKTSGELSSKINNAKKEFTEGVSA